MIKVTYTELDGPSGPTLRLEAAGIRRGVPPAGRPHSPAPPERLFLFSTNHRRPSPATLHHDSNLSYKKNA